MQTLLIVSQAPSFAPELNRFDPVRSSDINTIKSWLESHHYGVVIIDNDYVGLIHQILSFTRTTLNNPFISVWLSQSEDTFDNRPSSMRPDRVIDIPSHANIYNAQEVEKELLKQQRLLAQHNKDLAHLELLSSITHFNDKGATMQSNLASFGHTLSQYCRSSATYLIELNRSKQKEATCYELDKEHDFSQVDQQQMVYWIHKVITRNPKPHIQYPNVAQPNHVVIFPVSLFGSVAAVLVLILEHMDLGDEPDFEMSVLEESAQQLSCHLETRQSPDNVDLRQLVNLGSQISRQVIEEIAQADGNTNKVRNGQNMTTNQVAISMAVSEALYAAFQRLRQPRIPTKLISPTTLNAWK